MTTRVGQTRRTTTGAAAAALLIGLLAACSGPPAATGTSAGSAVATSAAAPATSGAVTAAAGYGTGACAPTTGSATPVLQFADAFADCLDPGASYTATITTSEGPVVVQLDTDRTPIAANNFVNLARSATTTTPGCSAPRPAPGSSRAARRTPRTTGIPGPATRFPTKGCRSPRRTTRPGVIAMANSGPDSGGGQFFFLSQPAGSYLGDPGAIGDSAGSYVVFGRTTQGLDVLQKISDLESPAGSSTPSRPVTIESVTITES